MNWLDVIKEIVIAGLSAFGGAWAAFLFESRREGRKASDDQYLALRFAHFVQTSQYQEFITIGDRYLEPARDRNDAWLRLHPLPLGFGAPRLNVSELGYLLEGPDPDLLNRLVVGQQRYDAVRTIVVSRNDIHAEMQRRAAALETGGVADPGPRGFEVVLGKDLVAQLKDLTVGLFDAHEGAVALLRENLKGLEVFASARFPGRRTPKVEIVPLERRKQP